MVTLTFTVQELQLVLKALEASDPMKLYAITLVERLVKEANEQLKPKEETTNE